MTAIYFAGIDLGSTMTKAAIIDGDGRVLASVVNHTGAEHRRLANKVMEAALRRLDLPFDAVAYVVATGYGRMSVPFADRQITELTCHARGVSHWFPDVRLAIDIGGQDAKGLKIKEGRLVDFVMSDKCAAGTGRFLEVIAATLGLVPEELGPLSRQSTHKAAISHTCTVYARQEVIVRLSEGVPPADIVAGIHDAVAGRVARMVDRLGVEAGVVFTGGVARNVGVVRALEARLGGALRVPEEPLLSGALGAALLAREIFEKGLASGRPAPRGQRRLDAASFFE